MRAIGMSGLMLALLAGTAAAQQPSQAQVNAVRQSCRGDYQSYCASVPTGGKASLQCLQQHLDVLSPPCHDAVAALGGGAQSRPAAAAQMPPAAMSPRQEAALMRRACGGDFNSYCSDVRLGGGRGVACLMRNEPRLSPQCRGALAEAGQSR
jgi:hypothetical protein